MAEPSTPDDDGRFIELPQPVQCALWDRPELAAEKDRFDMVEDIVDKSHLARSVLKCRECGQLYFYEFYEIVDWKNGNDRIYWTFIPLDTLERVEALKEASVFDLMQYTPRLLCDYNTAQGTRWIR